jgi:hypothetical protein
MLLALDDAVPDDVASRIRGLDSILDVWVMHLGPGSA